MPYSVSPRRRDQTVGPKPTMNWGTRMPNLRAQKKWPNSWKPMEKSRPIAKATIPRTVSRADRSASGDDDAGVLPGPLLRGEHVLHARGCAELRRGIESTRDDLHDRWERELPGQESCDGLLVRRVEHRRDDAAGFPRAAGQPHRRERLVVERRELPAADPRPVQR